MKILRNSILYVWATGIGLAQVGADSGWTFQNPQPTGNALRAVAALDVKTMIAVGAQGSILRTTDAGVTWKRISSGTAAMLSGVSFADANTGIAVGIRAPFCGRWMEAPRGRLSPAARPTGSGAPHLPMPARELWWVMPAQSSGL